MPILIDLKLSCKSFNTLNSQCSFVVELYKFLLLIFIILVLKEKASTTKRSLAGIGGFTY